MSEKECDEPDEVDGAPCGRHLDAQEHLVTERAGTETERPDGKAELDYDADGRQDGGETHVLVGELHC